MAIEGNTPKEVANYIQNAILNSLSASEEAEFRNFQQSISIWRDIRDFDQYKVFVGRIILQRGIGEDLCRDNRVEVDYDTVLKELCGRFALNISTNDDVDLILSALAELVVL